MRDRNEHWVLVIVAMALMVIALLFAKGLWGRTQDIWLTEGGWHYCVDAAAWLQLRQNVNHPDVYGALMAEAMAVGRCGITQQAHPVEVWPPLYPYMANYGAVVVVSVVDRENFGPMASAWWLDQRALYRP